MATTNKARTLPQIDTHMEMSSSLAKPVPYSPLANADGYALIESYIWDIGEDEEIEKVIDKALRILLIHPEFEQYIWQNEDNLQQIYNDRTFGKTVSKVLEIISSNTEETQENEHNNDGYHVDSADNDSKRHTFWNQEIYDILRQHFAINNEAHESYLWSFLLSIACCIKYLEIEIGAMPQYNMEKTSQAHQEKKKVVWKGFIVPPTHGAVSVNYDDKNQKNETEFVELTAERNNAFANTHCKGCYVNIDTEDINVYHINKEVYCSECTKFRVYQECVRKFVLEYDNEETRDDLWPWYENGKHKKYKDEYKGVLQMYSDQVLPIGNILQSNLRCYTPATQTMLDAQTTEDFVMSAEDQKELAKHSTGREQTTHLLVRSRTQFQPYRNIRYLRKFSAMFLLGEREIWKDLLKLKKYLKRMANGDESENKTEHTSKDESDDDAKAAIDDESGFTITEQIRENIVKMLGNEEKMQQSRSEKNNSVESAEPGIAQFMQVWSRLPHWWEPYGIHDQILLEMALMHGLEVAAYEQELDDSEYYQEELETHFYKAFEFWCTKQVNVQFRLRYLLFVWDNKHDPKSMVFMNPVMENSHLNWVKHTHKSINGSAEEHKIENDEKPVRNIEKEFRDIVQLLEPEVLGTRIWRFIINQMAAKQRKSLWKALTILAEELPSNIILNLLEEHRNDLRRGKPRFVNAVCQSLIKGSTYPTATALHLARYMEENAYADLARTEAWSNFANQYEQMAMDLVNEIESDHLLALLLEIPTDIQQKTIIEMAVLYKRIKFINSARIQGVMTHMWSEAEYLHPEKPVRGTYFSAFEFYELLVMSPVRFYYCPLGLYATTALLYVCYLLLVSYVSLTWIYPYSVYKFVSLETLLWISNAGYILYELSEFESKRAQYFSMDSLINVLDTLISVNWVILFILRVIAPLIAGADYVGEPGLDGSIDRALAEGSALERTDPSKRNRPYTIVYMGFWSLQLIILWIRAVGLLQRTEIMGPLLRMMLYIAKDVASFVIFIVAVTCGFLFSIHYIVGGDIDRDVTCDMKPELGDDCTAVSQTINGIRDIGTYLIQTLLGQQDWEVLDSNELYGFSRSRAQLLTLIVLAYVLLGTILSLNMLIAIMTTSFENLNERAKEQLAFLRVETTYDLAHRGRMMPPPINVFVIAIWSAITLLNLCIKAVTCGKFKLRLDHINPFSCCCHEKKEDKSEQSKSEKIKQSFHDLFEYTNEYLGQTDTHNSRKRYCKHCYFRMQDIKGGFVDDYFEKLSQSNFGIDEDDMRMIKRLFRYCALCPLCYRPYSVWTKNSSKYNALRKCYNSVKCVNVCKCINVSKGSVALGTNRYDRHHVLMEVISCYCFLLLVWAPMLIICFIPALLSKLLHRLSRSQQTAYSSSTLDAGSFGDYHSSVQQQTIKGIVDRKYNGTKAFEDSYDSDNDFQLQNNDDIAKLQRTMNELMERVNSINDQINHNNQEHKHKKKGLTQFQSYQKQQQII